MSGSNSGGSSTPPAAYTWTPAAPAKPEFTSTPTAAAASTGASASQTQSGSGSGTGSYTGTVLGG